MQKVLKRCLKISAENTAFWEHVSDHVIWLTTEHLGRSCSHLILEALSTLWQRNTWGWHPEMPESLIFLLSSTSHLWYVRDGIIFSLFLIIMFSSDLVTSLIPSHCVFCHLTVVCRQSAYVFFFGFWDLFHV